MDPILAKTYRKSKLISSELSKRIQQPVCDQCRLERVDALPGSTVRARYVVRLFLDPETGERERSVITDPPDLDEHYIYAKERRLVEEVKAERAQGRRCQVMWNMEPTEACSL